MKVQQQYRRGFVAIAIVGMILGITAQTQAAKVTRPLLKTYFETGDVPTESNFADMIDSFVHLPSGGGTIQIAGVGTFGSTSNALRLGEGETVGPSLSFADIAAMEPLWAGESGFLPLLLTHGSSPDLYGYFQIRMDSVVGDEPTAIHVDYFVYEDSGEPLLTLFVVPEPASFAALTSLGMMLAMRRRKIAGRLRRPGLMPFV